MSTINLSSSYDASVKAVSTQMKALHDGDLLRNGKVVHITNFVQRIIQSIRDYFYGGSIACDQAEFIDFCKNNNLRPAAQALFTANYENDPIDTKILINTAQQAKWLLKVKAHLMSSGIYANLSNNAEAQGLFDDIFGQKLEFLCVELDFKTTTALADENLSESSRSTLERSHRWIKAANNERRLIIAGETGQIPYSVTEIAPGTILIYDPLMRVKIRNLLHKRTGEAKPSFFTKTQSWAGSLAKIFLRSPFTHAMATTHDKNCIHIAKSENVLPKGNCVEQIHEDDFFDQIVLEPLPSIAGDTAEGAILQMQSCKRISSISIPTIFSKVFSLFRKSSQPENFDPSKSYTCSGMIAAAYQNPYNAQGVTLVPGTHAEQVRPHDLLSSPHLRSIYASDAATRASQKQSPATLKETLNALHAAHMINFGEWHALTKVIASKRQFRELSIKLVGTLNFLSAAQKQDYIALLKNNQFYEFYTRLKLEADSAVNQQANARLNAWLQKLPHPASYETFGPHLLAMQRAIAAGDSVKLHNLMRAYCDTIKSLKEHNNSRNDLYYVFAISMELEKLSPDQTIQMLAKFAQKDSLANGVNRCLAGIISVLEAGDNDTDIIEAGLIRVLSSHGIEVPIEDLVKTLDEVARMAVFFLKEYKDQNETDWLFYFYYGEFIEKFRALSSISGQHRWCGSCHHSHGKKPEGLEFPSTLYKHSPIVHEDQIINIPKDIQITNLVQGSVLVCPCSFGTGHKTAAAAVGTFLGEYGIHVNVVDNSLDTFLEDSTLHQLGRSLGQDWDCPQAFNWIIRNEYYRLSDSITYITRLIYKVLGLRGIQGICNYIDLDITDERQHFLRKLMVHRPDTVITTYHMDLNLVRASCEPLLIPVIHLPTDMGMKLNEPFKDNPLPFPTEDFHVGVPYNDASVIATREPLEAKNTFPAGYPVRPEFLDNQSQDQIDNFKRTHGIEGKDVVLIMTGGGGINVPYPVMLANDSSITTPMHVVVVAGNNNDFATYLKNTLRPVDGKPGFLRGSNGNVTIEIAQEATPDAKNPFRLGPKTLSHWESVSNVIVTKPGGASTAEGVYKKRQMVFDASHYIFSWEKFNIECIKRWGYGREFASLKDLSATVTAAIQASKNPTPTNLDEVLIDPKQAITDATLAAIDRSKIKFTGLSSQALPRAAAAC